MKDEIDNIPISAANEICRLLHEHGVKVGYFCGENLPATNQRAVDVDGKRVLAIIEPADENHELVPHWSISVAYSHIRIDMGGIGREEKNPHLVHMLDLADPKSITKTVDLVKNQPPLSGCYNLSNLLYDEVGIGWPEQNSWTPGRRTISARMDVDQIQIVMEGSSIKVSIPIDCKAHKPKFGNSTKHQQQNTTIIGNYRIDGGTIFTIIEFSWNDYSEYGKEWVDDIIALIKGVDASEVHSNPIDLAMIYSWGEDGLNKVAYRKGNKWEPIGTHTEEDIKKHFESMQAQVDRLHKKRTWTPEHTLKA